MLVIPNTTFHPQPPPAPPISVFDSSPKANERATIIASLLIGLIGVSLLAVWIRTRVLPRYNQCRDEDPLVVDTTTIDNHEEALWFDTDIAESQRQHFAPVVETRSHPEMERLGAGVISPEPLDSTANAGKADEIGVSIGQQSSEMPRMIARDSQYTVRTIGTTVFVGEAVEMSMIGTATVGEGGGVDTVTVRRI